MANTNTSKCTRCGKDRVVSKTWTESRETRVGVATVAYTSYVCPDPECQKIVESSLTKDRLFREESARVKLAEQATRRGFTSNNRSR